MSDSGVPSVGPTGGPSRWDALARAAAACREVDTEQEVALRLLTFVLDGAPYAVPVDRVREIVRIRPITRVPRVPDVVCGVISLRGEILEVIDLRRRLSLPPAEPSRSSRIVVIQDRDGRAAALLVDSVSAVLRVTEDEILPASQGETDAVEALCVQGDDFVSLIDLERVLAIDAER